MREEKFWRELLALIEEGRVIPVVGPELLTVMVDGREVPLYQVLAERLLADNGMTARIAAPTDGESAGAEDTVLLHPFNELNDAVCALAADGTCVQDLYFPIYDILKGLTAQASEASLQPLRALAGIGAFKLFVTTTPDDLLARAIDAVRYDGVETTARIAFSPMLPSDSQRDIPELPSSGYSAVCYLFGRGSPLPCVFAIHDEDTLEFIHNLHDNAAEGMRRLYAELREKNLLLIGCNFADWLSRFFIRLSNTKRLADSRTKHEFLIQGSAASGSLTLFLQRFSPATRLFPGSAREFVYELARRWQERHPATEPVPEPLPAQRPEETFFISYSHSDLPAARRLFLEMQEMGADVAWFDKNQLMPGDDWDQAIRGAINDCYLFLPLISANTEKQQEGYFRKEWKLASERFNQMQGRKFIVPIVIDAEYAGEGGSYRLVPDNFRNAQFGHAPGGSPSEQLRRELVLHIRERRMQRITG